MTGRRLLAAFFVALIFIGDVYLVKITLPLCMLLVPPLLALSGPGDLLRMRNVPPAAYLLAAVLAIVPLQWLVDRGPDLRWRQDLGVWLPLLWGLAAMIALRGAAFLDDRLLWRCQLAGGLATSAIMIVIMLAAPKHWLPVPGQDVLRTEWAYALQHHSVKAPLKGVDAFDPPRESGVEQDFYWAKGRVANYLGKSNYIAVFLVFLFCVALFRGSRAAAVLLAICAAATMSRSGIAFVAIALALWAVHRRGVDAARLAALLPPAAALIVVAAIMLPADLAGLRLPASAVARLQYWRSAVEVVLHAPLIGLPRSVLLVQQNFSITWNPHNAILWAIANLGIIGLILYLSYLAMALAPIRRRAAGSDQWLGIYVGLLIALAWGMTEIVWWTPAFEILLGSLYAIARNGSVAARSMSVADDGLGAAMTT